MVTSLLVESHHFGWQEVLVLNVTGFLFGLGTNLRGPFGIAVGTNTIDAARCPEAFRRTPLPRLPLLPRCVFGAVAFPVLAIPWYWKTRFLTLHQIYLASLAGLTVSAGAWLARASDFLSVIDRRKTEEITEFLSDPQAPVPQGQAQLPPAPTWFRIWNALNFTAFLLLTLMAIRGLLKESPLR